MSLAATNIPKATSPASSSTQRSLHYLRPAAAAASGSEGKEKAIF